MSRAITVSTDVFAAIWAKRENGEESENQILKRILGCSTFETIQLSHGSPGNLGGVHDVRNGVYFPQGFEIFRTYKRKEYKAVAQNGSWVREDTGQSYATLNQLNDSIAAGNENVWNGNWKYRAEDSTTRSINYLRHK